MVRLTGLPESGKSANWGLRAGSSPVPGTKKQTTMMTIIKRQPIAYSGSGSAIANYMKPEAEQEKKLENWATFTVNRPNPAKRKVLFSLMYQAQWIKVTNKGEVPDLERLSNFLQSNKSPVKKKLIDMEPDDLKKIIQAFKGITKSKWK